ncbi:MAG: type III pantothenate kinase [Faecalibacterium sp.]|jgi:type III pantothenate kinase|nr:type III pantothenate kinase [Faecalibacterium sp.]
MILTIDIGNTTIALGGVKDGRVCFIAHMDTARGEGAESYRPRMAKAFSGAKHQPVRFEGSILSSVVPELTDVIAQCAAEYCPAPPLIVSPKIRTGLVMDVPQPEKVGRDRIVDAAAAAAHYPLPVITVDMGTATTFNVVDERRHFLGGVICPGLSTGLRALNEKCAQLPMVRLGAPKAAIGRNTQECMLNGSILGTAAMIDGIAERLEAQLGRPATLVVTGGLARFVVPHCRHPLEYDAQLMLKGLAALYAENTPAKKAGPRRRPPAPSQKET